MAQNKRCCSLTLPRQSTTCGRRPAGFLGKEMISAVSPTTEIGLVTIGATMTTINDTTAASDTPQTSSTIRQGTAALQVIRQIEAGTVDGGDNAVPVLVNTAGGRGLSLCQD